jgi:DNA primase
MISKKSIQEILEKISIIELISDYTELKRSGKNFSGLCPFHEENTPSFYVDEEKKLFHCFGCKKGGNLIQFIQESEALGFVEALEYLSEKFNIPLEYENAKGQKDNFREYYELLAKVNSIYVSNLWSSQTALKYLKERSVSKAVMEKFGLGFSKGDIVDIADKKDLPRELLFKTGIISSLENPRESFKDRITIPLKDKYGKIKGFVARTITGNRYKYLNSQNSEIYDKAKLLFGFNLCRNTIREKDFSIVCEGVFDCMRLFEAGIENSVSVLGTKMSIWQLKELKRMSKNIFIMFDSDSAGQEASLELCRKAAETDINMRICTLPEKTDPDSFIKENGLSAVMEVLKNAVFYVDYFLNLYMMETEDVYKKGENFKICNEFINSISNYFIRNKYSEKVESFFSMKVRLEKKQDNNRDLSDKNKTGNKKEEISRYLKDLLNLAVTYDKVLDIIFKKYYKNIDDLNFKNIILNLHIGKTPAEVLCLDIPDVYKKMLLQYEFLPEKKLVLSDPEAEVVHIFRLIRREKILNEIEKCKKVINNPDTSEQYKEYQQKYIELIKELQIIE